MAFQDAPLQLGGGLGNGGLDLWRIGPIDTLQDHLVISLDLLPVFFNIPDGRPHLLLRNTKLSGNLRRRIMMSEVIHDEIDRDPGPPQLGASTPVDDLIRVGGHLRRWRTRTRLFCRLPLAHDRARS
jgi:hypothetical protein